MGGRSLDDDDRQPLLLPATAILPTLTVANESRPKIYHEMLKSNILQTRSACHGSLKLGLPRGRKHGDSFRRHHPESSAESKPISDLVSQLAMSKKYYLSFDGRQSGEPVTRVSRPISQPWSADLRSGAITWKFFRVTHYLRTPNLIKTRTLWTFSQRFEQPSNHTSTTQC